MLRGPLAALAARSAILGPIGMLRPGSTGSTVTALAADHYNRSVIAVVQDVMVLTEDDFDRLPDEGIWEVADGRAVLSPGKEIPHQLVSGALFRAFDQQLRHQESGVVLTTVNVFVPPPEGSIGEIQNRIPDLVVATHVPKKRYRPERPPELVIEILSTPRGNVERTEKLDDYARSGIREYWIVNPFDRSVDVYLLSGAEYRLTETARHGSLRPDTFPGVAVVVDEIWAALD